MLLHLALSHFGAQAGRRLGKPELKYEANVLLQHLG